MFTSLTNLLRFKNPDAKAWFKSQTYTAVTKITFMDVLVIGLMITCGFIIPNFNGFYALTVYMVSTRAASTFGIYVSYKLLDNDDNEFAEPPTPWKITK